MTQKELRQVILNLVTTCIDNNCYIKGYGTQFRVVDHTHSPIINISKQQMNILIFNKIYCQEGLVYKLTVNTNPFSHYLEINLP